MPLPELAITFLIRRCSGNGGRCPPRLTVGRDGVFPLLSPRDLDQPVEDVVDVAVDAVVGQVGGGRTGCAGSGERAMQIPSSFGWRVEKPELLAGLGADAEIVATHVGAAPPGRFDTFRSPRVGDAVLAAVIGKPCGWSVGQ